MKVCYVYNGDYNGNDEGEGFRRKLSLELEARGVEVYPMRPFMRHHTEQNRIADECEAAVVYSTGEEEFPAYYAGRFAGRGKPVVVAQSNYYPTPMRMSASAESKTS